MVEPRRFTARLPRPLWIGLLAAVLALVAAGLQSGRPIYRQIAAIREIERLGGTVQYDPRGPQWLRDHFGDERMRLFDAVVGVDLHGTETTDATLSYLVNRLPGLQKLVLDKTQVTNRGLSFLTDMPKLEWLSLKDTQVGDVGLAHLKSITTLFALDLTNTHVTDAGLAHLKGLTSLEGLILDETRITDAGLSYLARLKLLTFAMNKTRVTDAGLAHLKGMTGLKELYLDGTPVTDAGAAELKRALPGLFIMHPQADDGDSPESGETEREIGDQRGDADQSSTVADRQSAHFLPVESEWDGLRERQKPGSPVDKDTLSWALTLWGMTKVTLVQNVEIALDARCPIPDVPCRLTSLIVTQPRGVDPPFPPGVSDDGIRPLSKVDSLQSFALQSDRFTGAGLVYLRNNRELEELSLTSPALDSARLGVLEKLTSLRTLRISGPKVSDEVIESIEHLTHLETLGLTGTSVSLQSIARLAPLLRLKGLSISNAAVRGGSWDALTEFRTVEKLTMCCGERRLDPGFMQATTKMANLRDLSLRPEIKHSVAGRINVGSLAVPPGVRYLSLHGVPDDVVGALQNTTNLQELDLKVHDLSADILTMLGSCPHLQKLSVWFDRISESDLNHLQQLEHLQELELVAIEAGIGRDGALALANVPQLRALALWGVHRIDEAAAGLASSKTLCSLKVSGIDCSDSALIHIAGITQLESLVFSGGANVTPAGIESLHGLTGLKHLTPGFGKSPSSLVPLFAALPNLDDARLSFNLSFQPEPEQLRPILNSTSLRRCEILLNELTPELVQELASHEQIQEYSIVGNIGDSRVYKELARGFQNKRIDVWNHSTLIHRPTKTK